VGCSKNTGYRRLIQVYKILQELVPKFRNPNSISKILRTRFLFDFITLRALLPESSIHLAEGGSKFTHQRPREPPRGN
jgi:hypothetical protein